MKPDDMVGKICVFYSDAKAVQGCVVQASATKLIGTVQQIACYTIHPDKAFPTLTLLVKGRSGRTAHVDVVEQYAQFFPDWTSAMLEFNKPVPT